MILFHHNPSIMQKKRTLRAVIVEEKVQIVRQMFETYATGQYPDTIADTLRNPLYIGKAVCLRSHTKLEELCDGTPMPLISLELWNRCQKVRAMRHGSRGRRKSRIASISNRKSKRDSAATLLMCL